MRTAALLAVSSLAAALYACSSSPDTGAHSWNNSASNDSGASGDDDAATGDDADTDAGTADHASHDARTKACAKSPDALGLTHRTVPGGTYLGYAPATYDKSVLNPLVVSLHGAGDTAPNYFSVVWQANADAKGLLVVSPEGSYPIGPGYTWQGSDVDAILAAIDDFSACYSVDPKRVLIHGFSAGGVVAYLIGLHEAQRFSGISISSANLGSAEALNGGSLLPAPWKIPVSHFHGTQDQNFPIQTAIDGMNRLQAAGHTFYWHPFDGGHTTNAGFALQMYEDLASSTAP